MIKRSGILGAVLLLALVVIPAGMTSGATPYGVTGSGTTTCSGAWSGVVKFSPGLKSSGTSGAVDVFFFPHVATCTGGTPSPVKGKFVRATGGLITATNANTCSNFFAASTTKTSSFSPSAGATIEWKPTSLGLLHSVVTVAGMNTVGTTTSSPVEFTETGITTTGSFPTSSASFSFDTVQTLGTILGSGSGDCGSSNGVSELQITGSGSTGTF